MLVGIPKNGGQADVTRTDTHAGMSYFFYYMFLRVTLEPGFVL